MTPSARSPGHRSSASGRSPHPRRDATGGCPSLWSQREEAVVETLGKAKRVRIYVNEDDTVHGKPLHHAILDLLRRENAQGATVFHGIEGFGPAGRVHVSHLLYLAVS